MVLSGLSNMILEEYRAQFMMYSGNILRTILQGPTLSYMVTPLENKLWITMFN